MTIEEAIAEIRNKWAIPVSSIPELRQILIGLAGEETTICGQRAWPYTEHNVCVLKPGHEAPRHKDDKGREFDNGGYSR